MMYFLFPPQTFEMYVARADCSPDSGNKDNFVLKEGQFVEVLDSVHPDRWLVRTKPTKTNPARQGWVCPAYLEKKRKVGCTNPILSKHFLKHESYTVRLQCQHRHSFHQVMRNQKAFDNKHVTVF